MAAGDGGFYWPHLPDDFVGSGWQLASAPAVDFGRQQWIRSLPGSSVRLIVVSRGHWTYPLVAAGNSGFRQLQMSVDFVGDERWLVSAGGGGLGWR